MEYIYLIQNSITKRIYVGRTHDTKLRFRQHMNALKRHDHIVELMQEDFNLYGEDTFKMYVVQEGENFTRKGIECQWILDLKTYDKRYGYNYKAPCVWHRTGKVTSNVILGKSHSY